MLRYVRPFICLSHVLARQRCILELWLL